MPDPSVGHSGESCRGGLRPGVMPGAGKRSDEQWTQYRAGRLRCAYCGRYIEHDEKGRLLEHFKAPPVPPLARTGDATSRGRNAP